MSSTRITQPINVPPDAVYRALIEPSAVATWMAPNGIISQVHAIDGRKGGVFRISLTYESSEGAGKTTAHADTFHGRFVKLVPNEQWWSSRPKVRPRRAK